MINFRLSCATNDEIGSVVEGCTDPASMDPPYKHTSKYKLLLV